MKTKTASLEQYLLSKINSGEFAPFSQIPSQFKLMPQFNRFQNNSTESVEKAVQCRISASIQRQRNICTSGTLRFNTQRDNRHQRVCGKCQLLSIFRDTLQSQHTGYSSSLDKPAVHIPQLRTFFHSGAGSDLGTAGRVANHADAPAPPKGDPPAFDQPQLRRF